MANSRSSSSSCRTMPSLPAGFRFHPTDEELIVHYLMNQAACVPCPVPIIAEVNIYECNPWDLPRKAVFGENEWYFFSPRDRKYPNGSRPNRAAGNGYWKATGTDKAVVAAASTGETVGVKKALVFYMGRPPRGVKTDWIMHEYRLTVGNGKTTRRAAGSSSSSSSSSSMRLDDWVLCRIHKKSNNFQFSDQEQEGSSIVEEADSSLNNTSKNTNGGAPSPASEQASHASDAGDHQFQLPPHLPKSCSLTDLLNTIDYSTLSQLLLDEPAEPEPEPQPQQQQQGQSPLIYYATPACPQPQLLKSSLNVSQLQVDALFSDYSAGYYSRSSGLKRKRSSCDDGSSSRRKLQPLPSEATFFGSASGYCNQQLAEAASSSGGGFQCSGLLSHPLLNQQQLLLNSHLEMQMQ